MWKLVIITLFALSPHGVTLPHQPPQSTLPASCYHQSHQLWLRETWRAMEYARFTSCAGWLWPHCPCPAIVKLLSSINCSPEESNGNGVCFAKITAVRLAGSKWQGLSILMLHDTNWIQFQARNKPVQTVLSKNKRLTCFFIHCQAQVRPVKIFTVFGHRKNVELNPIIAESSEFAFVPHTMASATPTEESFSL